VSCMGVPQIVKTNTGKGGGGRQKAHPLLSEAMRPQRRAIGLRHHKVIVGQARADFQKLLGLLNTMGLQFCHNSRGQRDCARTATLGLFEANSGLCLLGRLHDGQLAGHEADIAPAQSRDFAAPQAAENRKDRRDEYPFVPCGLDQASKPIHTCCATPADMRWPIRGTTRGRYRPISVTGIFSTQYFIRSCRPRASRTFGRIKSAQNPTKRLGQFGQGGCLGSSPTPPAVPELHRVKQEPRTRNVVRGLSLSIGFSGVEGESKPSPSPTRS
jgi:hypothetical protein